MRRRMLAWALSAVILVLSAGLAPVRAQTPVATPPPAGDLLKVFLDCDRCDDNHVRQTVGFVDYVLDRTVADVHVLVTTQNTGGGGLSWIVQFIGVGRLAGQDHTLRFDTSSTATEDERRNAFARIFKLGLATRAAATSAAPQLNVAWTAPTGRTEARRDPWDYWVFNTRFNGFMNGERSSSSRSHNLFVSANRTTDALKITANASASTNRSEFKIDESETIESRRHQWNINGRVVKSLNARWSAGGMAAMSHSSFSNIDRAMTFAPAIEFNVFPYSESSRRSLTFHYAAGLVRHKYTEITIFEKHEETLPRHGTSAVLNLQQPWGSLSVASNFTQFLDHPDRYRYAVSTSADVRLFKGFSFNVFGEYERIRDQISLRRSDATEQEVLLQLRQQATGYSYFLSVGISYRFGSILNNIVNTRFNGSVF